MRWQIVWGTITSPSRYDYDALADRIFALDTDDAIEASMAIRQAGKMTRPYERALSVRIRRMLVALIGMRIVRVNPHTAVSAELPWRDPRLL